ncbi:MBL fold metallo-hydrolase [Fredinandcohnia quinoae]|uniref:MBL fold metallo-hydrolase n=1 Tax=Fredinandcohnia quinoae TaxID=2918902 RepID=A0AAW5DZE0_9BACI|nr:MBL fold metallo-hydrolase [Fredinandcohnia sp. SECRCQ15]MCH1624689.1 MBL fold metallo-hydrolase [Fredinandcohnia sp. SECRCQ15]
MKNKNGKTRYFNYDEINNLKSIKDMLRWSKERRSKKKDLTIQIPQHDAKDINQLRSNRQEPSITWVGHSTFLIQLNGINILTDPVWAQRMGIQKRMTAPGIALQDLPKIDIVCISHGHYDHLDFPTIKKLIGNPTFYVPIGLKSAFTRRGYENVVEAKWWESFTFEGLKLTFVPAQHWTRRSLLDTNTSHWGGWMIEEESSKQSIYFVGDTGYFRGFKEIGEKYKIDIVLMPIGAYEPEWFMKDSHINPEDAIKAFKELNGKTFIPMHYGAYRLADDTGPEALERLIKEWNRVGLSKDMLSVLTIGETKWLR